MAVAEKRPLTDSVFSTKHILMDIEGTTTSISFVKDTLFPYVRKNLDGYLKSQWSEEEFKNVLALLRDQADEDKKAEMEGAVEIPKEGSEDEIRAATAKNVLWQMDADRKTTALKKLQGHMWRQGYKNGELKGHLFSDVVPALREWAKDGRKLYVYSSGSVEAQKLLFGNSTEGNLTELFTDFFDTAVGAKVEVESYKSIVKKLDCNADDVLFLTDLPKEATAAREAGLPVLLVEREGNEPLASDLRKEFSAVSSFAQVSFETVSKKHKAEEDIKDETASKKQKVDEDAKEEKTTKVQKVEDLKEETKPAENDSASMDVDPVESAVAEDTKVTESEVETDAMDVDKPSEEPKIESTKAETVDDKTVESHENGAVEKSEENAAKTEVAVTSEENGSVGEPKSKQDSEDSKAVEVDKKCKAEESQGAIGDSSESSADKANPAVGEKEKPLEEVSVSEKAEVKEKTEVPQEKTEEKDVEKMETDCENKLPKEDSKTEEDKPDVVVEASTVLSEPKKDNDEKPEDVKVEDEKTVTEVIEVKKDSVIEVTGQDAVVNEQKVESTEVKIPSAIEASAENQNKSEKTEENVSKESNGEANGNANGEANGNASGEVNGETKQVTEKENGEKENGEKEKVNGSANGSANGKDAETNGKVSNGDSNGHSKEKDIPEVIVTKNAAQIENGSGDAAVVVEA